MFQKESVSMEDEFRLLAGMIVNNDVMGACYARYKAGELKTKHFTQYFRPVVRWLLGFYGEYKRAPGRTMQEIFRRRKWSLNAETLSIVEEYLDRLASEYADGEDFDPEFTVKEILLNFIRRNEIEEKITRAQDYLEAGDAAAAEATIKEHVLVTSDEDDEGSPLIEVFSEEDAEHDWGGEGNAADAMFSFDGDLGNMIGPLERTWLVAVTGKEKVGKSYVMQEVGYQGAMFQKKKVLIINLELSAKLARNRLRRRITRTANPRDAGRLIYPILDCENNQHGTCKIYEKKALLRNPSEFINWYKHRAEWEVCTECKGRGSRRERALSKRFLPTVWFDRERVRELDIEKLKRSIKENKMMGVSNIKVKCFPRFSITFDGMEAYILRFIEKKKWKPDIIICDYLDILAPENDKKDERIIVDRNWKKASKLAGQLNCLFITADQATKVSRTQRSLDQMSTSESKTKDSHLDVRVAFNQTDDEKDLWIGRMAVLFHRHAQFSLKKEVLVTQRLATAEAIMDNGLLFKVKDKYRVQKEKV